MSVEGELAVVGLPGIRVVIGVKSPIGFFTVNDRPSKASYLVVCVKVGKIVANTQTKLPVLFPKILLNEKTVPFKALDVSFVTGRLRIQVSMPHRVRPLKTSGLFVGKENVEERVRFLVTQSPGLV
jgi:hypothetical protein